MAARVLRLLEKAPPGSFRNWPLSLLFHPKETALPDEALAFGWICVSANAPAPLRNFISALTHSPCTS